MIHSRKTTNNNEYVRLLYLLFHSEEENTLCDFNKVVCMSSTTNHQATSTDIEWVSDDELTLYQRPLRKMASDDDDWDHVVVSIHELLQCKEVDTDEDTFTFDMHVQKNIPEAEKKAAAYLERKRNTQWTHVNKRPTCRSCWQSFIDSCDAFLNWCIDPEESGRK